MAQKYEKKNIYIYKTRFAVLKPNDVITLPSTLSTMKHE